MNFILVLLSLISGASKTPLSGECESTRKEYLNGCVVSNSCFTDCIDPKDGGAIYVSECSADITNCTFDRCSADDGGAVMFLFKNSQNIYGKILFCTFTNCVASYRGGGIFISQNSTTGSAQPVTLENCEFSYCKAKVGGSVNLECKQAVFVRNCIFDKCYGAQHSQVFALYSGESKSVTTEFVEIDNCSFIFDPKTNVNIRGIQIQNVQVQLKIGNCTFRYADYEYVGAQLLYINVKTIDVISPINIFSEQDDVYLKSITENNINNINYFPHVADVPSDEACQNVITERTLVNGTTFTISNTCFVNCKSDSSTGGALYIEKIYSSITSCNFYGCSSESHGGAIHIMFYTDENFVANLTICKFFECFSTDRGGAIYLEIKNGQNGATVDGCTFEGNIAKEGGGLYVRSNNNITVTSCIFKNNIAKISGASFFLNARSTNYLIADNNFEFTPGEANPNNVIFGTDDGVTTAKLTLGDNYFKHNGEFGTWTHLQSSNIKLVEMTGCLYTDSDKSAIQIDAEIYDTIQLSFNCIEKENCQCDGFPHLVPDDDGYFPQNSRIERKDGSPELILVLSKFIQLGSTLKGGAVFLEKCSASFTSCKFEACNSTDIGGAIYCSVSGETRYHLTIVNTSFTNCLSQKEGGAIYYKNTQMEKHKCLFENCKFIQNSATINGGAISLFLRDNCKIMECTFQGNDCVLGSSIYAKTGNPNGKPHTIGFEVFNNKFEFTPTEGSSDVCISAIGAGFGLVILGRNSFKHTGIVTNFKHLEIEGNFSNVIFTECLCFDGDKSKFSIPDAYKDGIEFLNPDCIDINTCSEAIPETTCTKIEPSRVVVLQANFEIDSSCFSNIETTDSNGGGALFIDKLNCSIRGSNFKRCKDSSDKGGGAVRVVITGPTTTYLIDFHNCNFTDNSADIKGGAVSLWNPQPMHSLQFYNCHFFKNNAASGGALYLESRGSLLIKECHFATNTASRIGASLYLMCGWESSDIYHNPNVITGCTFNFKPGDLNLYNVYITGMGAGAEKNANLEIGGCYFSKSNINKAVHLYIAGNLLDVKFSSCICVKDDISTVVISDKWINDAKIQSDCDEQSTCKALKLPDQLPCQVRQDLDTVTGIGIIGTAFKGIITTGLDGGAIKIYRVQASIKDSIFDSCSSTLKGGAVFMKLTGNKYDEYHFTVENTIFKKCSGQMGGALYIESTREKPIINITQAKFENNDASSNGGGLYMIARGNTYLIDCQFTGNTAQKGSSLYYYAGINDIKQDTSIMSFVKENHFSCDGAQISNVYFDSYKNGRVTFNGNFLTFTGTKSATFKHFIATDSALDFTSAECNCINGDENSVDYNETHYPTFSEFFKLNCDDLSKCLVSTDTPIPTTAECHAYSKHIDIKSKVTIQKTCFYGVSDKGNGGAINALRVSLYLEECRFSDCTSNLQGGALYVYWSQDPYNLNLTQCVFSNCKSDTDGGAVFLYNTQGGSKSNIINCEFTDNYAGKNGGAFHYSPHTISLLNSNKFIKNSCGSGVGLSVYNVNGYQFSGALVLEGNQVEISNNIFRSEPKDDQVDLYIKCIAGSNVEFKDNSFAFAGSNRPSNATHIKIITDGNSNFIVSGEICVDSASGGVEGLPPGSSDVTYNCKKAVDDSQGGNDPPPSKSNKTGIIVGVVVAVIVVIVAVVVGIILYKKKNGEDKYLNDLNDDEANNENANTASNL